MTYDLILVPQGAEAAAVKRGVKQAHASTPVLAIAMGSQATTNCIQTALDQGAFEHCQRVLVLGVAGSLAPTLKVGDVVVYQRVLVLSDSTHLTIWEQKSVDAALKKLPQAQGVTALSSDRLIHLAQEKRSLYQRTGADAVDMEAAAIIETLVNPRPDSRSDSPSDSLAKPDLELTTVRIISDNAELDLPDLEGTQRPDGTLNPGAMAIAMVRQPRASLNLIQGSLRALRVLELVTAKLLDETAVPS